MNNEQREDSDLETAKQFLTQKVVDQGRHSFAMFIDKMIIFLSVRFLRNARGGVILLRLVVRWAVTVFSDLGADIFFNSAQAELLTGIGVVGYDYLVLDRFYIMFLDMIYLLVVLFSQGQLAWLSGVHRMFFVVHPAWWQNWTNGFFFGSMLLGFFAIPVLLYRFVTQPRKYFWFGVATIAFALISFFNGIDVQLMGWLGFFTRNYGKHSINGFMGIFYAWVAWGMLIGLYLFPGYIRKAIRESVDD